MMNTRPIRRGERGYNLVEVLIAMALLGVVMISIITLFLLGRSNVYSGKQMTKAISIGTRITEDFTPMTADEVLANFGLVTWSGTTATVTPTVASAKVGGVTYANCVVRDTANISSSTDPKGYLAKWKALVPASVIQDAKVSIVFMPRTVTKDDAVNPPTYTPGSETFDKAPFLQMRIVVEWKERLRTRSIVLDAQKNRRI